MRMRRPYTILFLVFSVAAAWMLRGRIESLVDGMVCRHSARKTLAAWGLPPSRDNVDLYLSANHARPLAWESHPDSFGNTGSFESIPQDRPFSGRWTYGQLFDPDQITIGVYNMDAAVTARMERISRDYPAGPGRRISVTWLRSRDDLLRSLANDTIVFYFGHANTGQGIRFDPQDREKPIPMDDATLDGLDVKCKVFGYFGCRTDRYFRDIWNRHFPATDFLATAYVCHTTRMAPDLLRLWVEGLQQGLSLGEIVDALNRDKAAALLFGRMSEARKYHDPDPQAATLFTY